MKRKSVLVFSVIIVSLTFVTIAGDIKEYELMFKDEGDFCVDDQGRFVPCRPEGDLLNVSHLGLCDVWYQIDSQSTDPEYFGPFKITGANGDILEGYYSDFSLDFTSGVYMLEWTFTGGTGKFDGAYGLGTTNGLADLSVIPPHAEFKFYGKIAVPK